MRNSLQRETVTLSRGRSELASSGSTVVARSPHTDASPEHDAFEGRVVRQFVEALLFEGLVERESRPRSPADPHGGAFDALYDLWVDFRSGSRVFRCAAAIKSFGRVRVAPGSVTCLVDGTTRSVGIAELVESLPLDAETRALLLGELNQTIELSRWNHENLPHEHRPRRLLGFHELESAIVEGHPYHPCFKTRSGFSLDDHRKYGPEAGNSFQLEWLAITKAHVRVALPSSEETFWEDELGALNYTTLTSKLTRHGRSLRDYSLVPIHPWQLRALRDRGLERAVESGDVVLLGPLGDRYRATQSLRTLSNATRPEKAHVKLPLDVVCTSARRNLQKQFVCAAPLLSEWLVDLVAKDPFLAETNRIALLREYAGVLYEPKAEHGAPAERKREIDALGGLVGCLLRESVLEKLGRGEAAVPFTALLLVESDGRPFVADWLATYGVEKWIERLVEVVVVPIWHILVHHGVAFESHPQNLVLVHRDGWPERIVLRDFHEETEFVLDYLRRPETLPDFARVDPWFSNMPDDDGYRMASTESLRELFMDTVYVFNLADLSFLLERHFGLPEAVFWRTVRNRLDTYERSGVTAKSRIDRLGTSAPEIVVESLLQKKIRRGDLLDFFEHRVPNALGAEAST